MGIGVPGFLLYRFRLYYTLLLKEVIFHQVNSSNIKSIENKIYYHSNYIKVSRENARENGVNQTNRGIEIVPNVFDRKFIPIHNDITTLVTVVHNKIYNENIQKSDIILLYNENLIEHTYEDFKKRKEFNKYSDYNNEFSNYDNEHKFINKEF